MSKVTQPGDFFVVGGPVQPDRDCYVVRPADQALLTAIDERRFSYVLSPRATGKSSLMARTIRRLRADGQLAAVVDLAQIGARSEATEAGRWFYSIAYRIVRELRLKLDLQDWWHDKAALSNEQRLVEFFWDIVLANTKQQVTVFIDEADRAVELPFAPDLFSACRSCYMRRISEPDFTRLNFVVLGVATPEQLQPDPGLSPFVDGRRIELQDFSLNEAMSFARGFGDDTSAARGLMTEVHRWTGGHPYLTQKVARALARKRGRNVDVDQTVRELLLAPGAAREEPLLSYMRSQLQASRPGTRQAIALLGRIARGVLPAREPTAAARNLLTLTGILSIGAGGVLGYRNRIFASVFDSRYAKASLPVDWRRPVLIAAALLPLVALPYWYLSVLPRPYIETLSVVSQDYEVAEQAYERLRRLPGFGGTAERLLAEAMLRRSAQATSYEDVLAADQVLRSLPERASEADGALARYWLGQAEAAMHAGERDNALMYALAARDGDPQAAEAVAAELIGTDYPLLERSFRLPVAPLAWAADWERERLVVVDATHRVRHLSLGAGGVPSDALRRVPGRLTALQHVEVVRTIDVTADGVAGAFSLLLTIQHARASDLLLRLVAPSGAQAELPVPQPRADQQQLIFTARRGTPLAALTAEELSGTWQLAIVDQRAGEAGELVQWGLRFSAGAFDDVPEQGVSLPDPVRTEQVEILMSDDGRRVLAVPSRAGVAGAVSVWDLDRGELVQNLPVQSAPEYFRFLAQGDRAVLVTDRTLAVFDIGRENALTEIELDGDPILAPAISIDERYLAVAIDGDDGIRLRLLDLSSMEQISDQPLSLYPADWSLSRDARALVVADGSRRVRVLDPETGAQTGEFVHQSPVERVISDAHGDSFLAVDSEGMVIAWPLSSTGSDAATAESRLLGTTMDPGSVVQSRITDRLAFISGDSLIGVRSLHSDSSGHSLNLDGVRRISLAPGGNALISEGESLLRVWRLDAYPLSSPPALDYSVSAIDPDGAAAAFGFRGGHLRLRDLGGAASGAPFADGVDYIGHRGAVTSLALAPRTIVSGGADGVVRIWDRGTLAPNEYFLRHPSGAVRALDISADGRLIMSGADSSARVWAAATGELLRDIQVDGQVRSLRISPASDIVAVGDSAGNIFYGLPRGTEPLKSVRAGAAIGALAFSVDGSEIASGDSDGNLIVWDLSTAAQLSPPYRFSAPVDSIGFVDSDSALIVKSGQWVHRLERGELAFDVVATRLLPASLGQDIALAALPDSRLRALGAAATGRMDLYEFSMESGGDLNTTPGYFARDWSQILGLELDPQSGRLTPVFR